SACSVTCANSGWNAPAEALEQWRSPTAAIRTTSAGVGTATVMLLGLGTIVTLANHPGLDSQQSIWQAACPSAGIRFAPCDGMGPGPPGGWDGLRQTREKWVLRTSRRPGELGLSPAVRDFYARTLRGLNASALSYLVGGAYALAR